MTEKLRLMCVLAHPDDESLGNGGVLAKYAAELVTRLQRSGEVFLSNAVIKGTFLLRACIVNFRTSLEDIEALPGTIIRIGREVDATIRPKAL